MPAACAARERVGDLRARTEAPRVTPSPFGGIDLVERPPVDVLHHDEVDAVVERMSWRVTMFG